MKSLETQLTRDAGIEVPLIGGAMYPCSNPELVAAVSEAGGIGIVQPISLTYVHGHEYRSGLRLIKGLTSKPIGFNALIEASSRIYHERMVRWVHVALEEGVRFFVSSLGNPRWVVDAVEAVGGKVYHDVTERKWAEKSRDAGVHGLVAVNRNAGGHAGSRDPEALFEELAPLGLPVVCAGGVGDAPEFAAALAVGYVGAQVGTRFIATTECSASEDYKRAIVAAGKRDIVLTERVSGVPLAVINTPYVQQLGTRVGPIARWMLKGRRTKRIMRTIFALRSFRRLRRSLGASEPAADYWQAGRSVESIRAIESVATIVGRFAETARATLSGIDR